MNDQPLRIGAFESRRHAQMARQIERLGGHAFVSPSVREVPLDESPRTRDFIHRLITGDVGIVIFMTGVGFEYLLELAGRQVDRQRYLNALSDVTTIARGPKALAALKKAGIPAPLPAPAPHTWRDILRVVDQQLQVDHKTVGLQAHGGSNSSLIAGLEARGAEVLNVPVYRWALPEDTRPLEENVRRLAAGQLDIVLFTAAPQVMHVARIARELGVEAELHAALQTTVVGAIGEVTGRMVHEVQWPVDIQPDRPQLSALVQLAVERGRELVQRKRSIQVTLCEPTVPPQPAMAPWYNGPFMRACRREPTAVTPIWFMRQAGRYMAEYRAVRKQISFLELCKDPALCSEVMCTAVEKLGVDAAIVFSDLLPILEPMGFELEFVGGTGPVIHNPVRTLPDVDRVLELEGVDSLHFVMEAVRQTRNDLPADIPLIGFAGAPFTLASYTIEGGASRNYLNTKTLMYRDSGAWNALMERLTRAVTQYLNAQIAAGAQCVQLFDSWVGCLGPADYRQHVLPYVKWIVEHITAGVPVIYFGTGNPALLPLMREAESTVVGVDWRVQLDDAWQMIGLDRAIQGNLDPCVLLADPALIRRQAAAVLEMAAGHPGHIFNLGHGVLLQTPVDHAVALVDAVHEISSG